MLDLPSVLIFPHLWSCSFSAETDRLKSFLLRFGSPGLWLHVSTTSLSYAQFTSQEFTGNLIALSCFLMHLIFYFDSSYEIVVSS